MFLRIPNCVSSNQNFSGKWGKNAGMNPDLIRISERKKINATIQINRTKHIEEHSRNA